MYDSNDLIDSGIWCDTNSTKQLAHIHDAIYETRAVAAPALVFSGIIVGFKIVLTGNKQKAPLSLCLALRPAPPQVSPTVHLPPRVPLVQSRCVVAYLPPFCGIVSPFEREWNGGIETDIRQGSADQLAEAQRLAREWDEAHPRD